MPNPQKLATEIRIKIIQMVTTAQSGHLASALGLTDLFVFLYFKHLKHDPKNPSWADRDYFFMSNGHACPVWYATLAKAGYFPESELSEFRQINSRLQGHPHYEPQSKNNLPGIENTSGSLGQGLSQACGLALAFKRDKKKNHIYCLISDGELEEGQTYEALLFANKHKLDNLTLIIDRNFIQIEGNTQDIMPLGSLQKKINSFGWNADIADGHNFADLEKKLSQNNFNSDKQKNNQPTAIIMGTIPGKDISFMENNYQWHGKIPDKKETEQALSQLKLILNKI